MSHTQINISVWIRNLIAFSITLFCLYFVFSKIDIFQILEAYKDVQWIYLVIGIISLSVGYSLRIFRWSLILRSAKYSINWKVCAAPFLGSIALNNILPLRIGDVVRAVVFSRVMGISKVTGTSSLLMERLVDLVTLLLCLALGLIVLKVDELPSWIIDGTIVAAIVIGIVSVGVFLCSGRLSLYLAALVRDHDDMKFKKFILAIGMILSDLEVMSRPRVLFMVLTISMFIWIGEAGLFYCLLLGLGLDAHPALALIVMAVATLSTIVPSSPGYVGPFHLAAFVAISNLGGTATEAGSYAILSHFVLWASTTFAGFTAILFNPNLFKTIRFVALSTSSIHER